ncbi:ABC1 kinase family protein [Neisseriaceae bacterium CLB008]|nr:phosphotransferase [Neisseriaceae bacterium]
MITKTFIALRDLPRLKQIVSILAKHGLGSFIQRMKLMKLFNRKALSEHNTTHKKYLTTPQRFRMAFEELGPTFIKLGQILSTRVDMFPPEWTSEFAKLQNDVQPMGTEVIQVLVTERLKQPIPSVFDYFSPEPIGSASIAQVHRATLKTGEDVVVKVKRPNIEAKIQADLRILTYLTKLMESEIPELRRYQPTQMLHYFTKSLAKELNLSIERRYLQRFNDTFSHDPTVNVPLVYPEYSSHDILVESFVADTLLTHLDLATLSHDDRHQIASHIADAILSMILKHGFFHADPHPGNILVGADHKITFIDFGLVGHLSNTRRKELINLINALVERDQMEMQFVLSNWAQGDLPDETQLGMDVLEMMLNYEHLPMKDLKISQVIHDITSVMREHELTLPPDLVMLFKTLITLEGVVKNLDGEFQLLEHTKPLVMAAIKSQASPRHLQQKLKAQSRLFAQFASDLPANIVGLNRKLKRGQLSLNLDVKRLEQFGHQIDKSANRLTMGIVTGSLIIGSSIVMSINAGPKIFGLSFFGFIGYMLAFFNSVWLIWSIWRSSKN